MIGEPIRLSTTRRPVNRKSWTGVARWFAVDAKQNRSKVGLRTLQRRVVCDGQDGLLLYRVPQLFQSACEFRILFLQLVYIIVVLGVELLLVFFVL